MKKHLISHIAAAAFTLSAAWEVSAAPLPTGTLLTIESSGLGASSVVPCSVGSCLGLEISPGIYTWEDIGPGSDGGFIVGKAQKCALSGTLPGELTAAFQFPGMNGDAFFCTDPGGDLNLFDDTSCSNAGCLGKSQLDYFYVADANLNKMPLGSSFGVTDYQINSVSGGAWSMDFNAAIPSGIYQGLLFRLLLRGQVTPNHAPLASNVNLNYWGFSLNWTPVVSDADGNQLTCRITSPVRIVAWHLIAVGGATASVAPDCSSGFLSVSGIDIDEGQYKFIFDYTVNDGIVDSKVATVTAVSPIGDPIIAAHDVILTAYLDTSVTWKTSLFNFLGKPVKCVIQTAPLHGVATVDPACASGTYTPEPGYLGTDTFRYQALVDIVFGSDSGTVVVTVKQNSEAPTAGDVALSTVRETSVNWSARVSDPERDSLTCRILAKPMNGVATVGAYCSSGAYGAYQPAPGFVGIDSFTYVANDGTADSAPGTVTVAVTEGAVDQVCIQNNSVSQFTQTGKEGTLTISFTGNIVSYTNKVVKLCPGTTLKYQTSSTQGPVVCQVKNNTTRGSGSLKINDHIKCSDKPTGKDKVHFKVKSGVR